jgi:hypothetical protein
MIWTAATLAGSHIRLMASGTSGIQIWTLVVAALAVLFSLGGIAASALFTRRIEHRQWVRDLKFTSYSDVLKAISALHNFLVLTSAAQQIELNSGPFDAVQFKNNALQAFAKISDKTEIVRAFGDPQVSWTLKQVTRKLADAIAAFDGGRVEELDSLLDIDEEIQAVRFAMQWSLGVKTKKYKETRKMRLRLEASKRAAAAERAGRTVPAVSSESGG